MQLFHCLNLFQLLLYNSNCIVFLSCGYHFVFKMCLKYCDPAQSIILTPWLHILMFPYKLIILTVLLCGSIIYNLEVHILISNTTEKYFVSEYILQLLIWNYSQELSYIIICFAITIHLHCFIYFLWQLWFVV